MGRLDAGRGVRRLILGVVVAAGLAGGPAAGQAGATADTAGETGAPVIGPAGSTTTTTRPERPGVFTPTVAPATIANRAGCGRPTRAAVSTGTTGGVEHVTFKIQVGGRITTLSASRSGSRWSATLDGAAFGPDHGSGAVRATAVGPGGSAESANGAFTLADCPA